MSLSSGSDITIPIQDSPPPPPSPYANRTGDKQPIAMSSTPEPSTPPSGIENKGYMHQSEGKNDKSHTAVNMSMEVNGVDKKEANGGKVNEAVNSELINMSIMGTIPAKPQSEFGPYEQMDDYFIPVNQHKKFLRRSEKLYVTKDKRKGTNWKRYICWTFGAFFLAAIVAVAILAAVGVINIPIKGDSYNDQLLTVTSTAGSIIASDMPASSAPTTTHGPKPPPVHPDNTYVPMAADVEFHIENRKFEAALANKSSDTFQQLAKEVEDKMKGLLKERINLDNTHMRVIEFIPGSVYVKMRLGWMDDTMAFNKIQFVLSNVTEFGGFEIKHMKSYEVVNLCKFNNNGCSHFCTYDLDTLEFLCTCPESMLLSSDRKHCKNDTEEEPSPSEEPSPEPETPSEETTSPEPETVPEVSPFSSSAAPPLHDPPTTSSTTTAQPRTDDLGSEDEQTTLAPSDHSEDKEEPVPAVDNHDMSSSTTTTTTTTTTTEQTPVVPGEETQTDTPVSPTEHPTSDEEMLAHGDEIHPAPSPTPVTTTTTTTTTESPTTVAPIAEESGENESGSQSGESQTEHSPSTSTTTTTTTTPFPVVEEPQSPSHAENPIESNLNRGESDSGEKSNSNESSESISHTNVNTNSSSERIGRHETFLINANLESSAEVTTVQPEIENGGPRPQAIPNSGEFMLFSDNLPAHSSSQQTSTESVNVSKEKLSAGNSEEVIASSGSASVEDIHPEIVVPVISPETATTTPKPKTYIGDTDVNHLDNVTEDTVNSEQVQDRNPTNTNVNHEDGKLLGSIQSELPGVTDTSALTSSEEGEEVHHNRDHLTKAESDVDVDTTLSPVVYDVPNGNNENEDSEGVTTTPAPSTSSTTTTAAPTISSSSSPEHMHNGQESENELS